MTTPEPDRRGDRRIAVREALRTFLLSRALVAVTALLASRAIDPAASGKAAVNDVPALTHPFGGWPLERLLDTLLSPLARWDAVWYLQIADDGYSGDGPLPPERRAAFFPLFPYAARALAGFSESSGAHLIAAYAISLAAFLGALYLLYRLVDLELGSVVARMAVLLLAFSPWTVFFSAPYTESLFLLLTVGAFYAARTGRWAWAGGLAALASATRVTGVLLIVPLVLLYLYDRDRPGLPAGWRPSARIRPDIGFLALAPVGLVLFSLHLWRALDDPLAWLDAQRTAGFGRQTDGPLAGLWAATREAAEGVAGVFGADVSGGLQSDTMPFLVLLGAVAVGIALLRSLHPAYGAYALVALVPSLWAPSKTSPLLGLPRYATVLFPLFVWLAAVCVRRGWTETALASSALLAGLFTAQFATWQFVS